MRTVFLGTSQFAASVLERLAAGCVASAASERATSAERVCTREGEREAGPPGRHCPLLVITRPDRPAGRGRRLQSPPVAHAARSLGIELAQPASVNEDAARELIAAVKPEVVIVCAFGALIKEPLLSEHELLNVHPSLLPRWRGAAPVERAIMAGDAHTGVSIMRLTSGLDSGPVCLSQSESIAPHDTYGTLAPRLQRIGAQLLERALDAIERAQPLPFSEQDDAQATYAEKVAASDRLLDPARPAAELERVVRALHPHIGARLALPGGVLLGVLRACVAVADDLLPGALAAVDGRLLYGTATGALELLEVQPAGGRAMDAASYLRGHTLERRGRGHAL